MADAARRKELEPAIDGGIESLRKLTSPKHYWVLGLEGRYHLMRGENVDAIRVLEEASKSMPAGEVDMMYLLAQVELAGRQVGPGRWWLQRVVETAPNWVSPRLKLTELQLADGDVEGAKRNLAQLPATGPEQPRHQEAGRPGGRALAEGRPRGAPPSGSTPCRRIRPISGPTRPGSRC